MKAMLALLFLAGSAGVAAADGWIDCNGPDKNGRGCGTSGTDGAAIGTTLALVALVTSQLGRRRKRRS